MANSADVKSVEKHINKCFDNISGLLLIDSGSNTPDVNGMISSEREEVEFARIKLSGASQSVEKWMKQIETNMQLCLVKKMKDAYSNYNTDKVQRKDWVLSHIGQAIACVSQITWTETCELIISEMEMNPFALQDLLSDLKLQLS